MRVGLGYDLHALVAGRRLVIGGVELQHTHGLEGHSDADVLVHAVVDALLGAAALGTIGEHFPDTDARYAGVSSLELLAATGHLVRAAGYRALNIDSVVVAEGPRLQPHLRDMAERIAFRLDLQPGQVAVKATSPEGVGALGRGEAIAAQAVVLIEPSP